MPTIVKTKEGQRLVYPEVNRNLSFIAQSTKLLYCEFNRLCGETPINLVGSILMYKYKDEFISDLVGSGVQPSKHIINPFMSIGDVVLEQTGHIARDVFLKNGCGRSQIGIATKGDLAGLILQDFQMRKGNLHASAANLFNDRLVHSYRHYLPYEPNFYRSSDEQTEQVRRYKHLYDRLKRKFFDIYIEFAGNVSQKMKRPGELKTSDLFFAACDEIGLPIDRANFHLTIKA